MSTTTQRPTPETDALHAKQGLTHASYRDFARKLERQLDEAKEQLEREQMRLVACDVVAMADTESSRGPARDMHKEYWSAAVEFRKQLEAMREAIKLASVALDMADDEVYPPQANCSCHISPPCNDCLDHSVSKSNSYTLEVCHETKEYLETDSSD